MMLLWAAALFLGPDSASARQIGPRGGVQVESFSAAYALIDFEFDGDDAPLFPFDYDQPAYGFVYTRPRLLASFFLGDQDADEEGREDLRLLDVSLMTWADLRLGGVSTGRSRAYVPVVLFSNYRRVSPQGSGGSLVDAFNVTVVGLGLGLGLDSVLGETALFEARGHPVVGFATSSLTDAFGGAYLIDADAQLHIAQLFGAVGLSLGYNFRLQVWNVNTSDLFPEATDELFDYKSRHHLFRVGVNW